MHARACVEIRYLTHFLRKIGPNALVVETGKILLRKTKEEEREKSRRVTFNAQSCTGAITGGQETPLVDVYEIFARR